MNLVVCNFMVIYWIMLNSRQLYKGSINFQKTYLRANFMVIYWIMLNSRQLYKGSINFQKTYLRTNISMPSCAQCGIFSLNVWLGLALQPSHDDIYISYLTAIFIFFAFCMQLSASFHDNIWIYSHLHFEHFDWSKEFNMMVSTTISI